MLLDTIAQAIWNEHRKIEPDAGSWSDAEPAVRDRFAAYAHAALEAMSHPTAGMLSQGNRALQTWEHSEHYRSPIDGIYHAMIAAELPAAKAKPREFLDEF